MRLNPLALSPVALLLLACGGGAPKKEHHTPDAHITAFTVEPTTIPQGGKATLTAQFREGIANIEGLSGTEKEIQPWVFEVSPEKTTTYTLNVKNAAGKPVQPQTATLTVVPPDATISAPESVGPNLTGYTAQVSQQIPEAECTFAWTIENGAITSDPGLPKITFTAPSGGFVKLTCTVTNSFNAKDTQSIEIPVESGLSINIVGLPNGISPDITLEYPDGTLETITNSGVIKHPPIGIYKIRSKKVLHEGLTYHPWQPEQHFTVKANETTEAKVLYPLPVYVAQIKDINNQHNLMPMEFMLIPAGTFEMGPSGGPTQTVSFKTAFYMARTECTQAHWKYVTGNNPSRFKDPGPAPHEADPLKRPVECVSWPLIHDSFLLSLNNQNLGPTFSLPSESQWEYACRAGITFKYFFSEDGTNIGSYAWHGKNADGTPHSVAMKMPNQWGLCDMVGNVWEWCADDWHPHLKDTPVDGSPWKGPNPEGLHALRGGAFIDETILIDGKPKNPYPSAYRQGTGDTSGNGAVGFRLAIHEPQFSQLNETQRLLKGDNYINKSVKVDPQKDTVRLRVQAMTCPYIPGATAYIGFAEYDEDGNRIICFHHMYEHNTLTTLADDLDAGDTEVSLTDASKWNNNTGTRSDKRKLIFWNYESKSGTKWGPETYSRNLSPDDLWEDAKLDKANGKITLRKPWAGPKIPKDTQLSQASNGGWFKYAVLIDKEIPGAWTEYTGTIGGVESSLFEQNKFSPGTAAVQPIFLNRGVPGSTLWITNLKIFKE